MSTAAGPVYGQQYIRFAETAQVDGALAIDQFRVVQRTGTTDPTSITNVFSGTGPIEALGVIQQKKNLESSDLGTDLYRLATVATSGLLLVAQASAGALSIGDPLSVNAAGEASDNGVANTDHWVINVNGTTPIVRQVVEIGGESMALVSFN